MVPLTQTQSLTVRHPAALALDALTVDVEPRELFAVGSVDRAVECAEETGRGIG